MATDPAAVCGWSVGETCHIIRLAGQPRPEARIPWRAPAPVCVTRLRQADLWLHR